MAMMFGTNLEPDISFGRSLGSSSKKWKLNGHVPELIEVSVTATTASSSTISNDAITAGHVVVNDMAVIDDDVSYTTADGSITLSCSGGIPAMKLYLGVKS